MKWQFIRIGMDNVDSYWGGCTTHFSYLITKRIYELGGWLVDYPKLIRLNPDIPWKTRGNGCVCLETMIKKDKIYKFTEWCEETLLTYMDQVDGYSVKNQPAVVITNGELMCDKDFEMLHDFYSKALCSVVSVDKALEVIENIKDKIIFLCHPYGLRGLIGALSALGNMLINDYTYELLIYRRLDERDRDRLKNFSSNIIELLTEDEDTFAHIDPENNKILITPTGPDPVVAGIRGNKLSAIFSVFRRIKKYLDYSGWMVFVTNQGTNANLLSSGKDNDYYQQIFRKFTLLTKLWLRGGHLFITGESGNEKFAINFYYESGRIRTILDKSLNDRILKLFIGGGVKPNKKGHEISKVINPQLIVISNTTMDYMERERPICPKCKVTLKSGGMGKLYKCKKCGYNVVDVEVEVHRKITIPNILLPPYRSILHISKPLKRMGREKRHRFYGIKKMRWIY